MLALFSAVLWGFAAFSGGQAARRSHLFSVMVLDQTLAALFSIPFGLFLADQFLLRDFLIGGASGLSGSIAVAFFYLGLRTNMVAVAPIAGVVTAILPVLWGLSHGEHLAPLQMFGVVLGLASIFLVSGSQWGKTNLQLDAIINGVLAGAGFGLAYIILDSTNPSTAPWPIVGARVVPAVIILLVAKKAPWPAIPSTRARPFIVGAVLADVLAAVLFLAALNRGLLSVSSVLSCLHPAITVLLARFFLRERISVTQGVGLFAAVVAVSMITIG